MRAAVLGNDSRPPMAALARLMGTWFTEVVLISL